MYVHTDEANAAALQAGQDEKVVGHFEEPWALDANQDLVDMSLSVDEDKITTHVEPGPDAAYPIVTDPAGASIQTTAARSTSSRLALALVLATTLAGCGDTNCDSYRFDGAMWARHPGGEVDSPRRALAVGLVHCKWLPGKTRREVRDGLGVADYHQGKRLWAYDIGSTDEMTSEISELRIRFGPDGRVQGAHIYQ
jgi:hypothetical protein